MRLNRITKYFPSETTSEQPQQSVPPHADQTPAEVAPVTPGAFAALPAFAMPMFGVPTAPMASSAAMNLYAIALDDAQRKLAQKKTEQRGSAEMELGDF
jgi:hypothetical protein